MSDRNVKEGGAGTNDTDIHAFPKHLVSMTFYKIRFDARG